jgi:hypothetical protein
MPFAVKNYIRIESTEASSPQVVSPVVDAAAEERPYAPALPPDVAVVVPAAQVPCARVADAPAREPDGLARSAAVEAAGAPQVQLAELAQSFAAAVADAVVAPLDAAVVAALDAAAVVA